MAGNIEQYRNQIALARNEIKNLRQQLSALKHEHYNEVNLIKKALNNLRCGSCNDSATTVAPPEATSVSPQASSEANSIDYKPIGVIETSFQNKRAVPRQPTVMSNATGTVVIDTEVFNNPEHAISGLEDFSHMWIIFHFHVTESSSVSAKVAPPRLVGERRGVFSTRSPHRPCPIGLSLVKIHSIEGNKIHFLGVDMVNGTPVLDIKPYIPQYDYPSTSYSDAVPSVRPPTEGISDIAEDVAGLQIDVNTARSISPRVPVPISIDTSPGRSFDPSPEETNQPSPSSESPPSVTLPDREFRTPTRPDSERGAPDGQERYTPPQSTLTNNHDGIRVPPWISNPPAQNYQVTFSEDALNRLHSLIGDRANAFKSNIECLLSEDPRSHYVRTRYGDHEYCCVLEDLSISCIFDSNSSICTIIAVRNAEDLQS